MRLLLDASHTRFGGGLQVALTTVDRMPQLPALPRVEVLCVDGSPIAALGEAKSIPVMTVENSRVGRLRRFALGGPGLDMDRYDCVYTIFGPPIRNRGNVVNVIGVAYSNLFYPEINFWGKTPLHRRPGHWAHDRLRVSAIRRADGWIFETEAMRGRALKQLGLEPARTAVISPSPAPFINNPEHSSRLQEKLEVLPDRPRVFLATSWLPYKNLHMVPQVAHACRSLFGQSPVFVLTLESDSRVAKELRLMASTLGVSEDLHFVGVINQRSIGQALANVQCVMLLSDLESFSSNVIEAFVGGLPLVISDRDWARAACFDAAVYVDPHDPNSVARGVMRAMGSERRNLVSRGAHLAQTVYLSPDARAAATARFLADVHRMGPVDGGSR